MYAVKISRPSKLSINSSVYIFIPDSHGWSTIAVVSGPAVEFSRVSKSYSIYAAPGDRLKELATLNRRRFHTDYWALRDVSFDDRTRRNILHRRRKRLRQKHPPADLRRHSRTHLRASPASRAAWPRCWNSAPASIPNFPAATMFILTAPSWGSPPRTMDRAIRRNRSLRRNRRFHPPAGQDLFERHGRAPRVRRRHPSRSGNSSGR